jgi:hypothetical protein
MGDLLSTLPPRVDVRSAFARSARLALAGLVGPPVLLGLASAGGYPLRAGVEVVTWLGALLGFAGAGWMAGREAGPGGRRTGAVVAGFLAAGTGVTPAFRGLQGLTGREPAVVVFAATLGAFAAGFGVGGTIAAFGAGIATSRLARTGAACAAAGAAGGALALLPYTWSLLGLRFPGDTYLWMALTLMVFLGCIIVPFCWMGAIIARGTGDGTAVEKG